MLVLKLPPVFPCRVGEGKRAAISKQTCFSQKRVHSYIVLALGETMFFSTRQTENLFMLIWIYEYDLIEHYRIPSNNVPVARGQIWLIWIQKLKIAQSFYVYNLYWNWCKFGSINKQSCGFAVLQFQFNKDDCIWMGKQYLHSFSCELLKKGQIVVSWAAHGTFHSSTEVLGFSLLFLFFNDHIEAFSFIILFFQWAW